jgi:hypothetical protein
MSTRVLKYSVLSEYYYLYHNYYCLESYEQGLVDAYFGQ